MITTQEQAIHLSPRDPRLGNYYFRIGLGHLLESRNDESIVWLEKARGVSPARPNMRASLAAAYALGGDTKCAAAELTEARRLIGDDRFSSITRLKEVGFFGPTMPGYFGASAIRARFEATYFEGLRRAGVPEG